ncbi:hypothetical protein VNI00_012096 [Paramarasmius palmivorus]|uniref:Uncharacterized protein n=1 Tax=Paramarasmius palmivorus TaxID=297713 RepID=A0AAW0C5H0_9AGAR
MNAVREMAERTEYDEFQQVRRGDIIALENLYCEDLSQYEWQWREGRILGRLKACVTTQIVQLFPYGGTKFIVVKYEGADAEKAWKKLDYAPTRSRRAWQLQLILRKLSYTFDNYIKRYFTEDDLPESERARLNSALRGSLDYKSSQEEWDQDMEWFLCDLHLWGLELSSEVDRWGRRQVKVKDPGTIAELDDEEDLLNITSYTTKPNNRTSTAQENITSSTRREHGNTAQSTRSQTPASGNADSHQWFKHDPFQQPPPKNPQMGVQMVVQLGMQVSPLFEQATRV